MMKTFHGQIEYRDFQAIAHARGFHTMSTAAGSYASSGPRASDAYASVLATNDDGDDVGMFWVNVDESGAVTSSHAIMFDDAQEFAAWQHEGDDCRVSVGDYVRIDEGVRRVESIDGTTLFLDDGGVCGVDDVIAVLLESEV